MIIKIDQPVLCPLLQQGADSIWRVAGCVLNGDIMICLPGASFVHTHNLTTCPSDFVRQYVKSVHSPTIVPGGDYWWCLDEFVDYLLPAEDCWKITS